jgi:hypothetical protein
MRLEEVLQALLVPHGSWQRAPRPGPARSGLAGASPNGYFLTQFVAAPCGATASDEPCTCNALNIARGVRCQIFQPTELRRQLVWAGPLAPARRGLPPRPCAVHRRRPVRWCGGGGTPARGPPSPVCAAIKVANQLIATQPLRARPLQSCAPGQFPEVQWLRWGSSRPRPSCAGLTVPSGATPPCRNCTGPEFYEGRRSCHQRRTGGLAGSR